MTKYLARSPMPNQTVATGTSAMAGMGRNSRIIGERMNSTGFRRPVSSPTITPAIPPSTKPTTVLVRLKRKSVNSTPASSRLRPAWNVSSGDGKRRRDTVPLRTINSHTSRSSAMDGPHCTTNLTTFRSHRRTMLASPPNSASGAGPGSSGSLFGSVGVSTRGLTDTPRPAGCGSIAMALCHMRRWVTRRPAG